jgi:hypothetical protein
MVRDSYDGNRPEERDLFIKILLITLSDFYYLFFISEYKTTGPLQQAVSLCSFRSDTGNGKDMLKSSVFVL